MYFQGQQLVSRATYISSRSLLSVSAVTIFATWFKLDLSKFTPMGIQAESIEIWHQITFWVLVFLLINHVLSWWGDYRSFKKWNSGEKEGGKNGGPLTSEIKNTIDQLKTWIGEFKSNSFFREDPSPDPIREMQLKNSLENIQNIKEQLEKLKKGISLLNCHAKIYFFGWYLAMPVLSAAFSLYLLLWCS